MGQDGEIRQGANPRPSLNPRPGVNPGPSNSGDAFEQQLAADRRTERRLAWRELIALGVVLAIVLARLQFAA